MGGGTGVGAGGGAAANENTGRSNYFGIGTLGTYTELEGVPFAMHAMLQRSQPMTEVSLTYIYIYIAYVFVY